MLSFKWRQDIKRREKWFWGCSLFHCSCSGWGSSISRWTGAGYVQYVHKKMSGMALWNKVYLVGGHVSNITDFVLYPKGNKKLFKCCNMGVQELNWVLERSWLHVKNELLWVLVQSRLGDWLEVQVSYWIFKYVQDLELRELSDWGGKLRSVQTKQL